jgi:hypothetical protein
VSDTGDLLKARAEHKSLYVTTLCSVLYDDAEAAYVELPSPDQTLTDELNTAYLDIANGADAVHDGDAGKGYAEVAAGSASLSAATRLLASFGVG